MKTYMDRDIEKDGLERFEGVVLLNPGFTHTVIRPQGTKGITRFRIYPCVDGGVERPLRLEPNVYREKTGNVTGITQPDAFYPWLESRDIIRMAGVNGKFTIWASTKGKEAQFLGPVRHFLKYMTEALKNGPKNFPADWCAWVADRNSGNFKTPLPRVEKVGMVQGIAFESGGKLFVDTAGRPAPQHPSILLLQKTAKEELEKLCNLQVPNTPEDNFDQRFVHNRLVTSANGSLIRVVYHPAAGRVMSYYGVEVESPPYPLDPSFARNEFKDWDLMLREMTEQEQMDLLVEHYPPEAVDYIFGSSPRADLLPKSILGKFHKMTTAVSAPAAPAAYQQPAASSYVPPAMLVSPALPTSPFPASAPVVAPPAMAPAAPMLAPPPAYMPPPSQPPLPAAPTASQAPQYPPVSPTVPSVPGELRPPTGDAVTDQQHLADVKSRLQNAQAAGANVK